MAMQIELKWEVLLGKGWERGEEKRKREEKEERGKILPSLSEEQKEKKQEWQSSSLQVTFCT